MIKLSEQLDEIKETQRQVSMTSSIYRKKDLQRRLKKLWKEYNTAKQYIKAAERRP